MSFFRRALSALKKIGVLVVIAAAFSIGLVGSVYLSLRSPEVQVPDVVGKDLAAAEETLSDSGLSIRRRATRSTASAKPNTVIDQLPRPGSVVKKGITVAVDISSGPKSGEGSSEAAEQPNSNTANSNASPSNTNENRNRNRNANNSNGNRNANNTNNANTRAANANNSNAPRNANGLNANDAVTNRTPDEGSPATNRRPNANTRPVVTPSPPRR